MAYADAHRPPDARALAGASLLQIGIGVLVITGLSAGEYIMPDKPTPNPTAIPVPLPAPPPPEPTTSPDPRQESPRDPTISVPQPRDNGLTSQNPIETTGNPYEFDGVLKLPPPSTGTPGTGTTAPSTPAFKPYGPAPASPPSSWFSTRDYPSTAARRGLEGVVGYTLTISASGKVENCSVTRSSGHASLDRATCRLMKRRGQFEAGRDANRVAVPGTFSDVIEWKLPE